MNRVIVVGIRLVALGLAVGSWALLWYAAGWRAVVIMVSLIVSIVAFGRWLKSDAGQ